jgi:hypothetical protein
MADGNGVVLPGDNVTIVPAPTKAPTKDATLVVGALRDARMVGIQMGDITVHLTPEDAITVANALVVSANAVKLLIAEHNGTISLG